MIRNLKALGLSIVAVLAMSAFIASAAQAAPVFEAESYPVTIHGSAEVSKEKFTTEAGAVECNSSFHGEQSAASQTVTVHPTYTNCKAFGFLNATVNTGTAGTGCNYIFTATEKVAADSYKAHVDVECSAGFSITIVASTCEATVGAQTGLTTVDIKDDTTASPKKDVTVQATVGGIKYTVTKDGIGCPFGGTGAKTGGEYTASEGTTVTGQSPSSPTTKIGIQVAGE